MATDASYDTRKYTCCASYYGKKGTEYTNASASSSSARSMGTVTSTLRYTIIYYRNNGDENSYYKLTLASTDDERMEMESQPYVSLLATLLYAAMMTRGDGM